KHWRRFRRLRSRSGGRSLERPTSKANDGNSTFHSVPLSDSGVPDLTPALLRRDRCNRCVFRNAIRQAHSEHRALAWLARHGDVATHHLAELSADHQTKPSATVFARSFG